MTLLETRVPPVVLLALAGLLTWALALLEIDRILDNATGRVVGGGLVVVGVAVVAIGASEFRQADTTVDPRTVAKTSTLVTSGIFRLTRNPMYVGMVLVLIGWGSAHGSVAALTIGCFGFMAVLTRLQIIPEERMMTQIFGCTYATYRTQVRRWI